MKLDFSKCGYDDSISLDEEGLFDDSLNGAYGYKVFYNVPISYIKDSGFFTEDQMLGDDFAICGGQLEFCVDKDGNQTGEVLLWLSVEDFDDNGIENTEFVYYDEDISEFVDDFNEKIKSTDLTNGMADLLSNENILNVASKFTDIDEKTNVDLSNVDFGGIFNSIANGESFSSILENVKGQIKIDKEEEEEDKEM